MRHLYLTVFPKVNSRVSPDLLRKRISADLTCDMTFLSQWEAMSNTQNAPKKNCLPFKIWSFLFDNQWKVRQALQLQCWNTLSWKFFFYSFKWRKGENKKSLVIIPSGRLVSAASWQKYKMWCSASSEWRSHQAGTTQSVWGGWSGGILNPGVK